MKKPVIARGAKLRKAGGFTLVEMLIVVAIIAILIAVSIPLVNASLEKTRDATDQANERAAKAEAAIRFLDVEGLGSTSDGNGDPLNLDEKLFTTGVGFVYDAKTGAILFNSGDKLEAYGKCTGGGCTNYPNSGDHTSSIIGGWISPDGEITIGWVPANTEPLDIELKNDGTIGKK